MNGLWRVRVIWTPRLYGGPLTRIGKGKKTWLKGTSLVVQWLRMHLPMQGTRVQALVQEDPTCCGVTKSASHNY